MKDVWTKFRPQPCVKVQYHNKGKHLELHIRCLTMHTMKVNDICNSAVNICSSNPKPVRNGYPEYDSIATTYANESTSWLLGNKVLVNRKELFDICVNEFKGDRRRRYVFEGSSPCLSLDVL